MKITDISTRRIRLGAESWYAPREIPEGQVPYWEFPPTTLHTDEGAEGHTMDHGPLGQGRGSAYVSRFLESHHPTFRFGLKVDPLRVHSDGCQHLPPDPGLGVKIDWDWMEDHTVELIRECDY